MSYNYKLTLVIFTLFFSLIVFHNECYASCFKEKSFKAEYPLIVVSLGNPEGLKFAKDIFDKAKITYDWINCPDVSLISSGVGFPYFDLNGTNYQSGFIEFEINSDFPKGTKYKTIIFIISLDFKLTLMDDNDSLQQQIELLNKTIDWARTNNLTCIGMHLEGKLQRGKPGSNVELTVNEISSKCNFLIATDSSNYDGKFTEIGEKNNIPVLIFDNVNSMIPILNKLFNK